jgi:hypothetical protein
MSCSPNSLSDILVLCGFVAPGAGIRSRCLCAQGDLVGAVAVARHGLSPGQHDSIGSFLHLQGGLPGAHLALMGLQGLSLGMEAELCMATGESLEAGGMVRLLLLLLADVRHVP